MVVTGSRQEAVRYGLAMREYIKEKGYQDVHPLVAFSGSVLPDDVIPEEVSESSTLINPGLMGRDLRDAFDTEEDRKSTRLNSSHVAISYAVFCLKKQNH